MEQTLIFKIRKGSHISDYEYIIEVDPTIKLRDLKTKVQAYTKIEPLRQWITKDDLTTVLNDNDKQIKDFNLKPRQVLILKDLGPQMLWNMVFYLEYLGPIVVFTLLYLLGNRGEYHFVQKMAFWLALLHYLKREFETMFIHVFSRDSMPFKRFLTNCFHYWYINIFYLYSRVLFGFNIGLELFIIRKEFPEQSFYHYALILAFFVLFSFDYHFKFFESMNFMCHFTLSNLRKNKNRKERSIPFGYGFDYVSSANYFHEVMSWVCFTLFTGSYMSFVFTAFSFYQMLVWALEKQRRYIKEFGDKFPRKRKAMIPFII